MKTIKTGEVQRYGNERIKNLEGIIVDKALNNDDSSMQEGALLEVYSFMLAFGAEVPKNMTTDQMKRDRGMIVR